MIRRMDWKLWFKAIKARKLINIIKDFLFFFNQKYYKSLIKIK
jgi:hypothetical protein